MAKAEKTIRCPYGRCKWKAVGRDWSDLDTADVYDRHFASKHRPGRSSTGWVLAGTPVGTSYPAAVDEAASWSDVWWTCNFSDGRACPHPGRHHGCCVTLPVAQR